MTPEEIKETIAELEPEALFADNFDDALIGYVMVFNTVLPVYDRTKCIEILEADMSYDEAVDYFEFNVAGAFVGEHTPAFLCDLRGEDFF